MVYNNHGFEEPDGRAEEVLGNLLLHAFQSLELKARWHDKLLEEIAEEIVRRQH